MSSDSNAQVVAQWGIRNALDVARRMMELSHRTRKELIMAKIALAFSTLPDSPPATLIEWSKAAEDAGMAGVFMTEAGNDAIACSLALGLHTKHIMLGTAISNIYFRHPTLLANEAAAVQEFTGGRFILGLGTGHREMNTLLKIDMGDPMTRMREVVAAIRKPLDGGTTGPRVTKKLPIYLAGVSKPMVKLAGEIADGVIFNFFPPGARDLRRSASWPKARKKPAATPRRSSQPSSRPRLSPTTWRPRAAPRASFSRDTARRVLRQYDRPLRLRKRNRWNPRGGTRRRSGDESCQR